MSSMFSSIVGDINKFTNNSISVESIGNNFVLLDPAGAIANNSVKQEDLIIYASLSATVRPKTLIQNKPDQKILEVTFVKEGSLDLNVTAPVGKSFLTTDWTNVSSLDSQLGQDLETFGMTSIDISFNSGFIPQVTINFVDVRGATLFEQGSCSPYGAFFHQPWPIFELTVKGYYGNPVKYSLALKNFTTKFNPSNGNYESTAEFIGYSYAFLSDILIGYALAAPYMEGSEEKLKQIYQKYLDYYNDRGFNIGKNSFSPISSDTGKPITLKNYLDAVQKLQSGQDGQDPTVIDQIRGSQELKTLTDSEKLQSTLDELNGLLSDFEEEWKKAGGQTIVTKDLYQLVSTTNSDQIKVVYEANFTSIGNTVGAYNLLIDENSLGEELKLGTQSLPSNNIINNDSGVQVDLKKIQNDIEVKKQNFKNKIESLKKSFTEAANELIKKELGFVPTVRSFFTVLLANTELFLELLKDASADAEQYHSENGTGSKDVITYNNQSNTPINKIFYAWPTYVDDENKKHVERYPGINKSFRRWPEVTFTDNFIKALKQMIKDIEDPNGVQNDFLEYEGKPGYDNYLPLNAMESPAGEPTCNIAYFNNITPQQIYKNIGERFIVLNNMSTINPRYLYSSTILTSYRKYKELDDSGFFPVSFTNLDNVLNKDYSFSALYPKTNWGRVEGYNFFYTVQNDDMFSVIQSEAKEGVESVTNKVLEALGLKNDGSEYYFYDKDILLNPKEGSKTVKPDIHEIPGDSLVTFLPCENCTGAIEQGTEGAIVDFNEVLRNPVTNSRALLLKNDNLISNYPNEEGSKSLSLIEELTKGTGFNPKTGLNEQDGITRIVNLNEINSVGAFNYKTDNKWWRYNGLRLKKSTPWLTYSSSIGDLSTTSAKQWAKISNFSQVNTVILDTMSSAQIYPDYTLNYQVGYKLVYDTKKESDSNYGDFSYAYTDDIAELTHNRGNNEKDYGSDPSTVLDSGWYTMLPSYSYYDGDKYAYNYNKNKAYIHTGGDVNYPQEQWRFKQVYYSPASTDTVYDKSTILEYFKKSKTGGDDYQNQLQKGKYNKNWVNQANLIIDTPFWKHNFPSQESDSYSTESYSYSMFGSSVLAEAKFSSTGNQVELSKDGFYMGVKLDLTKGLGTYIGLAPATLRDGIKGSSQINQSDRIDMLTTHNQDVFNIYAVENKESKSQITNPSNLNRTQAWKGSLAYLFLANQLHRPWTGMYTNSNKYLGPQSILGSGSMSAIIPKHSVYLLGAVLWRMRESGLFISDDKKWNIEPKQSYVNGKYVDPLNVPLLPKELVFEKSTTSWTFNTDVLAIPNGNTIPTPPVVVDNGPYSFESDTISFDGPWDQLTLIKIGNTVNITTPTPNSITFTYKCGSGSNKFNFSVHSVTPKNSLLNYVKNTMCKKSNETDFDKVVIDDIKNGTYNSNWGVRPPMASLLINSNTFNRDNNQLGVICFPRADEWPAANLGMVYALDLEDEVYGDSGNVVNPFKNQYKIFTPIFGRKSGLTLRMSNNTVRYFANKNSQQSYINLLKEISNSEASKFSNVASKSGNLLLELSVPGEDVILQKLKNTSKLEFNTIEDILKSEKNFSGKDESYTKLSFIYHDIQTLGTKINLNEENGRSLRGNYYPGTHSNTQVQKVKDKEKDKKDQQYKLQNTNLSQNVGSTSLKVLPELKYNNEVLNTVEKSNSTNEDKPKKENLYEDEARGYLRGYIPIGPELWFMPTSVKEKFISLFEDFVGDFNNFNDSSDFDYVLKTIDPLNFPKPNTYREVTPNQTPINGIKQGLPDDLVYSNFVSIQGGTTEAPTVSVQDLQVDSGFTGTVAADGKTYYTKFQWKLYYYYENIVGSTASNVETLKKNTKFTKNGDKVEFTNVFGEGEEYEKKQSWYFSCTDRTFRKTDDTSKKWETDKNNPQKPLETELGKQFCGDPTKNVGSDIVTTFTNSEPHPSVKKWLDIYGLAERVKNIAVKPLGINNGEANTSTSRYNILKAGNQDVQQVYKMLFQDGYVLSSLSPRIWWGELKIDDESGTRSEFKDFRIKKTDLDEFISGFVEIVTSKQIQDTQLEKIKKEILGDDNYSSGEDDDIRLSTYKAFKSIYDKWISASKVNSGSEKGELFYNAIGEDGRLLVDHFSFVNRVNADIGDKAIINVNQLSNLLHNYTMSMYGAIDDVLSQSNFNFHALPGYVDLTLGLKGGDKKIPSKARALANMFLPQPQSSIFEESLSGPHFLCMYIGGLSQKLDLQNNPSRIGCVDEQNKPESARMEQRGDSFLLTDKNIPEDISSDTDSPGVVAFKVAFASQNQSHFTSVELDQSEYKNTQESLLAIEKIAQAASPDSTGGFITKGQSMYDIYLNRSYSCTVEALGNMMIQPLQYFQLENVPMFYGSYLIRDVKHSVTPNNVKTTFTGDRIPQAVVPIVEDVVAAFNLSPADKVSGNLGAGNGPCKEVGEIPAGQDPSPYINPNKVGASPANESPSFKKYGINLGTEYGGSKEKLLQLVSEGKLIEIGDGTVDKEHYVGPNQGLKTVTALNGKFYLAKDAAQAWKGWESEMKSLGIPFKISSSTRFGDNVGGGPHGYGIALDFDNLYQIVDGSQSASTNKNARINNSIYTEIAKIGVKYDWYNPWRLADNSGQDEIWHFEYWGPIECNNSGIGGDSNTSVQSTSITDKEKSDNQKKVKDFLKGKGYTKQQVAGIMGNIQKESTFNPSAVNKKDLNGYPSVGLIQWNGKYYPDGGNKDAKVVLSSIGNTLEGQLNFLINMSSFKKFIVLESTKTSTQNAAYEFARLVEVCDQCNKGEEIYQKSYQYKRTEYANDFYNRFNNSSDPLHW